MRTASLTLLVLLGASLGCGESELAGVGTDTERPTVAAAERGGEPVDVEPADVEALDVHVVDVHPHDRRAFTQGLVWDDGTLYESTGQYGRSSLRAIDLERGEILRSVSLPQRLFGEGLALVTEESGRGGEAEEARLVQLTWRANTALVWSVPGLRPLHELRYSGEGWGLCFDGERLVMSDGSSRLTFRHPDDFRIRRRLEVERDESPVPFLNELECVDGTIYANVWMSDEILRIDASSGRVTGVVDASGLLSTEERAAADVLNGIAYRPERGTFLVTGKYWPKLFEVEIVSRP